MGFLRFLEGIRNPVFDAFFSLITHLGEETVFILVGLVFFWCIDKRQGYYVFSVGFIGTLINQFLKLLFRVPRPWVKDPSFTIVESARAEATGYSFPSGHTQSSVGVFGSVARARKERALRWISLAICVLVPFSRLYLGVHTPLDVGVSIGIAILLVFGVYPLVMRAFDTRRGAYLFLLGVTVLSVLYFLFVHLYRFPADIDTANFESGMKNAYKILGCTLGLLVAYELDRRFIRFTTEASLLGQVLKMVLGLIPILAVKEGLRTPLTLLCGGNSHIADGVRYFLICLVAGALWPLCFPLICRLTEKKKKEK